MLYFADVFRAEPYRLSSWIGAWGENAGNTHDRRERRSDNTGGDDEVLAQQRDLDDTAHRFQMLGLGMAMEILFLIPFAGLLMLPVGVTAGTLLYCRIDWTQWLAANKLDRPPGFCPPRCLSQST